jgi:EAL domain-containing protein (putative c-di-GMP-specific phosphodiesterase class I)
MSQASDSKSAVSRILVIDDDGDFRRFMKLMIEPTGAAILAVRDMCSLLALRPRSNDLVLIDLVMPSIDGIQVLGELARYQVKSRIVLMSGRSADVLETAARIGRGLGLQIGGVLKKPFRLAQLRALAGDPTCVAEHASADPLSQPLAAADLLDGMKSGELQIVLQPIVEIGSGRPWAFEALARWCSEKHGLVYPNRFLPLAAEAGLMPFLSEVVVKLAAEQSAFLKASGHASKVCVNFDGADLSEGSLPETLLGIVQEFSVSPSALVIELTESRAAKDQLLMMETLARLRLQGFELALDDFGMAYSSLDRIRNLPFSILKIDRSFVSDVETSVRARGIVSACISLARRCKLLTVAEGIETFGQMQALNRMGCDMAQGYFVAKPMSPPDLLRWLNGRTVPRTSGSAVSRRKVMAAGS